MSTELDEATLMLATQDLLKVEEEHKVGYLSYSLMPNGIRKEQHQVPRVCVKCSKSNLGFTYYPCSYLEHSREVAPLEAQVNVALMLGRAGN